MSLPRANLRPGVGPGIGAAALLIACAALVLLSREFEYGSPAAGRPIPFVVGVLAGAGAVYLFAVWRITEHPPGGRALSICLGLGLAMRALLCFSTPIQEDDFYRYLWDGAVVAHGHSPYRFAPAEIAGGTTAVPDTLRRAADDSGDIVARINFPELTTPYPPVAQSAFALAHVAAPWSLTAWRIVIFVFDAAALALLLILMRSAAVPPGFALIYWWNPMLLMEAYNSAHMDVVALPFAVVAAWFAARRMPVGTALALALAAGAKLWPAILAPVLLRCSAPTRRRLIVAITAGAVFFVALLLPMAAHLRPDGAGLVEYSRRWEMNDALFVPVAETARAIAQWLDWEDAHADLIARVTVAALLLSIVAALSRRPVTGTVDLCNRAGIALGALFMLSPTQFPWYYLWMLPFLAVRPRASLLVWSATLPLYYLKFHYASLGHVEFFHTWVVWIEHGPVLAVAAWEARGAMQARKAAA